ncbi:PREDICTED: uncharacterized protein LOC105458978 [Wasmannia auropunctata]|uniref:uncharacterized protein LOC105458978 n=1 Tax=Wasmannia auropunctata TaxID=64793 RepID=UPI0005F08B2D|nr:PREDICTED: uncharacterized protein LOC105458978 [Wasmannia auropunctata]
MREAKKLKIDKFDKNYNIKSAYEGRCIVELAELGKDLKCCSCKKVLSLENIVNKKRKGLFFILVVDCNECNVLTKVSTGKEHYVTMLGIVHADIGYTSLNKLLACLNIPLVSPKYKQHQRENKKSSYRNDNKRILQTRPKEIVEEIYPHMCILQSSINSNPSNSINDNNNSKENTVKFDEALGNIVNIIVSGKIIDYATRNRKCRRCDKGHATNDHDCRKNFQESAKAMKADVGAVLINNSSIFKNAGLKTVRVIVGDVDSSTIAVICLGNTHTIVKLADSNHLKKNFKKELYELQKKYKEMKQKDTIPHIVKCFTYSIAQNRRESEALANTLNSIPHLYDCHENC